MRRNLSWLVFPLFATFSMIVASPASAGEETGNPNLKSIEAIAITPQGTLIIGDGPGGQIVAIKTNDAKGASWGKVEIADLQGEIAGRMGTDAKGVEINRLVVNPQSGKAYIAVRRLQGKKDMIFSVDGTGKVAEFPLEKVTFIRYTLQTDPNNKIKKVTDITWAGDRILAAVQASDTFASKIYSIIPKKSDIQPVAFSTETYHVAHKRWETNAPIRTVIPYEENGKQYLVGAFTCTPIVKYGLDELKAGDRVKGTSLVELGNGNTPQDMFVYEKGGKKYILMSCFRMFHKQNPVGPSPYWAAKVDYTILSETAKVNENAIWRTKGDASKSMTDRAVVAADFFGVTHMDKLDNERAVVVRMQDGKRSLSVVPLP